MLKKSIKINLPESGAFNPGIVKNKDEYIFVYRKDEFHFKLCRLDKQYNPYDFHEINLDQVTDPRLIMLDNVLYCFYSRIDENHWDKEHICYCILMRNDIFGQEEEVRVSKPGRKEKNWIPFVQSENIFLLSDINPHCVRAINGEIKSQISWSCELTKHLRGNVPAVYGSADGTYLSMFHICEIYKNKIYYDNYFYIFKDGIPTHRHVTPFLRGEDATEPYFRKRNIACTFPVGMIVENDEIIISYGDNDSCCKLMFLSLSDVMNRMQVI
jgi:predicted GH43/DUF377 family glycosyl hydrolase